ncbi:uncharacterized protein isoform X4 [Castor canadensis]|uniref:Uncharacterized protein isoform X4 n=2 Tax=Castor canadensis TaxID=51338 RepID=A0AC58NEJ8_CASCN
MATYPPRRLLGARPLPSDLRRDPRRAGFSQGGSGGSPAPPVPVPALVETNRGPATALPRKLEAAVYLCNWPYHDGVGVISDAIVQGSGCSVKFLGVVWSECCHHHMNKAQAVFLRIKDQTETESKPSPTIRLLNKVTLNHASLATSK